jgi:hypothetical protein
MRIYSSARQPNNYLNTTKVVSDEMNSDEDLRLRRGNMKESLSYTVLLPKNMDPYMSEEEKAVIAEKEEAEKEGLSEVDILREQLRKLLAKMDEKS